MKRALYIACSVALMMLIACKSHYTVGSISRSRIVIDNRYDRQPDNEAAAFLVPYKHQVDSMMGPVLGEVACYMDAKRPESKLSNLLPDILVAMSGEYGEKPDFGVYNIGGIRAALVEGKVTYGNVLDVAPFENKICFITLTGEKVLELFQQMAARGGECVSHGVELVISSSGKLLSASLNGKQIDPQGKYRITTIDYVAQGNDGMTAFKDGTDLNAPKETESNSRFVIAEYFRRMAASRKVVDAKVEGRITVKD